MQLKINFLCRDSILAAPILLDIALLLDLAKRAGMKGIQEWLSLLVVEGQSAQSAPSQSALACRIQGHSVTREPR